MSGQQPSKEEIVRAVYGFAAEQMRLGLPGAQIEKLLVQKGLDEKTAAAVVNNLYQLRSDAVRKAGQRDMVIGGLICVIGLVVTIGSYGAAASSPTGGSYVIAWGAVIFGAIQFFRGLRRYNSR